MLLLSEEQLQELQELAECLMPKADIAIILDVDLGELKKALKDPDHLAYKSYQRGLLISKAAVRKSVVTLAKAGSSPAQSMVNTYLKELSMEDMG